MVQKIYIDVKGLNPAPQGSKVYLGKGRMIESCKRLKSWRVLIKKEIKKANKEMITGPCEVHICFRLSRPKYHYLASGELKKDAPKHVITKNRGDLDKLVRACFDSLTMTAISDDASVIQLNAKKRFVTEHEEPGAQILILSKD